MILDSRMTWDKLAMELEQLGNEEPRSLLPLMLGAHSILRGDDFQSWCSRSIGFMAFELSSLCNDQPEIRKVELLNEFFFKTKDFQVTCTDRKKLREADLLLRDVLTERSGGSLIVALVYMHLATQLDLPMALVNAENFTLVKWLRGSKCTYLDLMKSGEPCTDDNLLQMINCCRGDEVGAHTETKFETVTYKKIMLIHLQDLTDVYRKSNQQDLAHATLSMLLKIDPNNLRFIGERALLRKDMGHHKEALSDLKRYLSFTEITGAPLEIQKAFREITALESSPPETLH